VGILDSVLAAIATTALLWTARKVGQAATGVLRTVQALAELAEERQRCYDAARRVDLAAGAVERAVHALGN
jgi:hypothetical protein